MSAKNSLVAFAVVLMAAALFAPSKEARADDHHDDLLGRVNEAIRAAGAPVTVERSNAFQEGVVVGHYTSFDQLVGAITYHKLHNALPDFSNTVAADAAVNTQECITGVVSSISETNMTLSGDTPDGSRHTVTMSLAMNQYDWAIAAGVMSGSNVKACSIDDYASQYGHVTKLDS